MLLKSSSRTITVNHKATINGYECQVWLSKDAITNIIMLKNIILQYRVTYKSDESAFFVHREAVSKKKRSSGCMPTACTDMIPKKT